MSALWTLLLAAAMCPPLSPVEYAQNVLAGRLVSAAADGCAGLLLTSSTLARVGPTGQLERQVHGSFAASRLVVDEPHQRLFVVSPTHGDEALEVLVTARNPKTLEVDQGWGTRGELKFLAPRKVMKPHASTGAAVAVQVRPDGGLALVTRVDSYGAPTSVLTSWAVNPRGTLGAPVPLGELAGPIIGGELVFALAPDGRGFVATGYAGAGRSDPQRGAQLYGLGRDGHLDPGFGDHGHAVEPTIMFAIAASPVSSGWLFTGTHSSTYRVVVSRFTTAGALDATYGKKGRQVIDPAQGALEHPRAMVADGHAGTMVVGSRFWRSEKRARPTLISLDEDASAVEVRELSLADAPNVDVVAALPMPGGVRLAGVAAKDPLDREPVTFWRPVSSTETTRRGSPMAEDAGVVPPPLRPPRASSTPADAGLQPTGEQLLGEPRRNRRLRDQPRRSASRIPGRGTSVQAGRLNRLRRGSRSSTSCASLPTGCPARSRACRRAGASLRPG